MPRNAAKASDANFENERIRPAYANTSNDYVISKADRSEEWFTHQYYLLYQTRLKLLTNRVLSAAKKQLGTHFLEVMIILLLTTAHLGAKARPVRFFDMKEGQSDFIYGITIKKSTQRRSVFDEFKEPNFAEEEEEANDSGGALITAVQAYESVCMESDALFLDNDCQRMELRGEQIEKDAWTTGCVIGVYGRKDRLDIVHVEQIVYPELAISVPWPLVPEERSVFSVLCCCAV